MRPPVQFPDHPFTWRETQRLGIARHRLDAAVRDREVRRVLAGVYVRADVPDTTEVRAAAAALVISPYAVVCDRTAAWLHGIDVLDFRELDVLPPLETFVLAGHGRTRRAECRGGARDLRPEDLCLVHGVRTTTPLRTALDLGCRLSRRRALAALDAFMRECGITHAEMRRVLPRYFRRRGVVQLRQLVAIADPRAESTGESWTRLEIVDAGLPTPQPQYWVRRGDQRIFRLDLAYPHAKVAVEYDGRDWHEGDGQSAADEDRRTWLRRQGWTVIVVDQNSFTADALADWLAELRQALTDGSIVKS